MSDFSNLVSSSSKGRSYLFSTGQAGFIIKSSSGQLLAIDLYLSDCVERTEGHVGFKRLLPKILRADELVFDVVIATHPHLDHFDIDTIPALMSNGQTKLFCSVDCEQLIKQTQMEYYAPKTAYVKPNENYSAGDFYIHFMNCDHGTSAPDAVGVVIEVDGYRIYEAGDTCLRLDCVEEIKKYGEIDVMIAPINGTYGNLNEAECAKLSKAIKPKLTIPCHYGMFPSHGGNPGAFYEEMKETKLNYLIMAQGERYQLSTLGSR